MESFGSFLGSAFFERAVHGQIRRGFLLSWIVMCTGSLMTCLWLLIHPDIHSYITLSGVMFCIGIALTGSLIQTNTDVEDQEAGRFSKFGSGWDLWGDNIISNKISQFFLTILIVGAFAASAYFFVENAHQEAAAKVVRIVPKAAVHGVAHTPSHSNVIAHHHKMEKTIHHQIEK